MVFLLHGHFVFCLSVCLSVCLLLLFLLFFIGFHFTSHFFFQLWNAPVKLTFFLSGEGTKKCEYLDTYLHSRANVAFLGSNRQTRNWKSVSIEMTNCSSVWSALNMRWTCDEHTLNMRWTCDEHALNMRWARAKHALNMRWTDSYLIQTFYEHAWPHDLTHILCLWVLLLFCGMEDLLSALNTSYLWKHMQ